MKSRVNDTLMHIAVCLKNKFKKIHVQINLELGPKARAFSK